MLFKLKKLLDSFSLPSCLPTKTGVLPGLYPKHKSMALFNCHFLSSDCGLKKVITKSPNKAPAILFSIDFQGVNLSLKLIVQKQVSIGLLASHSLKVTICIYCH